MTIDERLKRVIEDKFSTLKSASEFTGIPYRSLQSYISGKQLPGSEALITLHDKLKINLNWLLAGDESNWPTEDNRQEVCVNLFEYIELEYTIADNGTVPYCGCIATIYNRVVHHSSVPPEPWSDIDALKEIVSYEVKSYIDTVSRIKKQIEKDKK